VDCIYTIFSRRGHDPVKGLRCPDKMNVACTALLEVLDSAQGEPTIDVARLSRLTLGDRALERDLLRLFDCQVALLCARLTDMGEQGYTAAVAATAHTLKDSAREVGAIRVAQAADRVERAASTGEERLQPAIAALGAAATEIRAAIADLLRAA
jgi:HPt (histidine-containing phosphotransfer) domain-containing protein